MALSPDWVTLAAGMALVGHTALVTDQTISAPTPLPTPPARQRRIRAWHIAAVAVVAVAVAITATIIGYHVARNPDKATPNTKELITQCRKAVTDKLRAPSTAKWPGGEEAIQDPADNTQYKVTGGVDAQNGFGAMIRIRWACNGTWSEEYTSWDVRVEID